MGKTTLKGDSTRWVYYDLKFKYEQVTAWIFGFSQELDTGYTLTLKNRNGEVVKTLTMGSGLSIDTSEANKWKLEMDFGNDLSEPYYTFRMIPDNNIPPFDVIHDGKLEHS